MSVYYLNEGTCELCGSVALERCNDGVCRPCHRTESLEDCLADKQLRAMVGDDVVDEYRNAEQAVTERLAGSLAKKERS